VAIADTGPGGVIAGGCEIPSAMSIAELSNFEYDRAHANLMPAADGRVQNLLEGNLWDNTGLLG